MPTRNPFFLFLPLAGLFLACCCRLPAQAQQTAPPGNAAGPKPSPEVQALLTQAKAASDARNFEAAIKTTQQALEKAGTLKDKDGEAAAHLSLGKEYIGAGQPQKSPAEFALARPIFHAVGDGEGEAESISESGIAAYYLGQPLKARDYFTQALPLYRALHDRVEEAGMLMNIAVVTENTGDPKKALETYAQVLPIFRELKDKKGVAHTLTNIGIAYGQLEDYQKEIGYLLQGLAVYREMKDEGGEQLSLGNIGLTYEELYQYDKALDYLRQALALAQKRGDQREVAHSQSSLGSVYQDIGQTQKALEYFQKALATDQAGGDKRDEKDALDSVAVIYSRSGEPQKALEYFQKALVIAREMSDKVMEASILNNIGFLYSDADQPEAARGYFEQGRQLAHSLGRRLTEADALNGLGTVAHLTGRQRQALEYFRQALAPMQKSGARDSAANVLGNIANIELDQKQFAQARADYRQALAGFRSQSDQHGEASMLIGLGESDAGVGQWRTAAGYFRQAVLAGQAAGNRVYEASALDNLARMERKQNRLADAETHLRRAVDLLETVRRNFGSLSQTQEGFLAHRIHIYYACLNTLLDRGKTADAFALAQKTKARVLLDLLASGHADLSSGLTPEERTQEQDLRQRADYLNTQMVKEGVENEVGAKKRFAALKVQLRGVEEQQRTLTEALYARHPDLAKRRVARTATLADVAAFLPTDTALLEYIAVTEGRLALFVVTTDGKPKTAHLRAYVLPVQYAALAKRAAAFHAACSDPRRRDWRSEATKLYSLLIAPAARQLTGKTRLIVCPDGPLWDVPFQALLLSSAATQRARKDRFLADRFEIDYAYSATGLQAVLAERAARPSTASGTMLAFANPDFGSVKRFGDLAGVAGQRPFDSPSRPFDSPSRPFDSPSRPFDSPSRPFDSPSRPFDSPSRPFESPSRPFDAPSRAFAVLTRGDLIAGLPGTQREAAALKRDFPNAVVYTGAAAQESVVKQEAGKFRYLHFATHGFFNDAAPMLSSIVLAQPPAGSGDDGFLTAQEIFDLNLRGTEMAVLSACNTARGTTRTGEGVIGLTWALSAAGVPTQVVSQWSVDDACTATLMEDFYAGLTRRKQSKGAALREAAQALRRDGRHHHPYYWAPFVLIGDWR